MFCRPRGTHHGGQYLLTLQPKQLGQPRRTEAVLRSCIERSISANGPTRGRIRHSNRSHWHSVQWSGASGLGDGDLHGRHGTGRCQSSGLLLRLVWRCIGPQIRSLPIDVQAGVVLGVAATHPTAQVVILRALPNHMARREAAETGSGLPGQVKTLLFIPVLKPGALVPLVRALAQGAGSVWGRGCVSDRGGVLVGHHATRWTVRLDPLWGSFAVLGAGLPSLGARAFFARDYVGIDAFASRAHPRFSASSWAAHWPT